MQTRKIALLTMVHFFNDFYAGFLPPLLPLLMKRLDITVTSATLLASLFTLSSSITQPVFGYLADRVSRRYFVVGGPLFSALFMSSIGLAPNYELLLIILLMGGLGIACFHPQTAALAGLASGGRRGLGVSIFVSGGTLGYALGPLWIVYLVMTMGLEKSYLAAIPGLVFTASLLKGNALREKLDSRGEKLKLLEALKPRASAIGLLFVIVVVWAVVRTGFIALLPILYAERGSSLLTGSAIIFAFVISGVAGGLLGGYFSDKVGRRAIILGALIISVPFLYGFVKTQGVLSIAFLSLAGMFLMANNSVVIAMAQELIPEKTSTSSSIVMGLAWGIGGMLVVIFGMVAEKWGTPMAMASLSFLPIIGFFCALFLPRRHIEAHQGTLVSKRG